MSISSIYRAAQPITLPGDAKTPALENRQEFARLLEGETQIAKPAAPLNPAAEERLQLSQHAETRIRSRAIPWNEQLEKRISDGIRVAESKGSREALILADDVAVIANVRSKTVITAMDKSQMKDRVFTNIDSTVLV